MVEVEQFFVDPVVDIAGLVALVVESVWTGKATYDADDDRIFEGHIVRKQFERTKQLKVIVQMKCRTADESAELDVQT